MMLPYIYRLREDRIKDEEGREYTVYGLEAVDGKGGVLQSYPDIFFDKEKAEKLVFICNTAELPLTDFADVIEDALVEQ